MYKIKTYSNAHRQSFCVQQMLSEEARRSIVHKKLSLHKYKMKLYLDHFDRHRRRRHRLTRVAAPVDRSLSRLPVPPVPLDLVLLVLPVRLGVPQVRRGLQVPVVPGVLAYRPVLNLQHQHADQSNDRH